jgi:hypothetical protein
MNATNLYKLPIVAFWRLAFGSELVQNWFRTGSELVRCELFRIDMYQLQVQNMQNSV